MPAPTPATDAELAALVMEVLKDPAAYRRLIGRLRPKLVGRPHPRRRLPRLRGCLPSDLLAEGDREAKRIQLRPLRESHKLWSLAYRRREGLMAHADLTAAELFDAAVSYSRRRGKLKAESDADPVSLDQQARRLYWLPQMIG